jgi:hypothetical protein
MYWEIDRSYTQAESSWNNILHAEDSILCMQPLLERDCMWRREDVLGLIRKVTTGIRRDGRGYR